VGQLCVTHQMLIFVYPITLLLQLLRMFLHRKYNNVFAKLQDYTIYCDISTCYTVVVLVDIMNLSMTNAGNAVTHLYRRDNAFISIGPAPCWT